MVCFRFAPHSSGKFAQILYLNKKKFFTQLHNSLLLSFEEGPGLSCSSYVLIMLQGCLTSNILI